MNVNKAQNKTTLINQLQKAIKLNPIKVPPGAKQIGNYILGKTIGSGTFGKVHLGLHIPTGQRVAVKIIQKLKLTKKEFEHIHRQIQILKRILHPSLIQLYEIIETQKSILLITEFMQNGQLFNYIVERKKYNIYNADRLSEEESCRFFHQIMDGLQYLHGVGITHRDIKPENILIDYNGRVKIIDFGLSNFYQKNQKLRTQCGSPCYAAPQMIKGKDHYDPLQVDIWSVGIVLFSMIAGYLPFCDPDIGKLYDKILSGKFKFPNWVSQDAKSLIEKMLIVDPSQRITLQQIFQHPWYQKVSISKGVGIDPRCYRIPYDFQILTQIKTIGFKAPKLHQDLQKNIKSQKTAFYYILIKKLVRQNKKIPSFFGDYNFDKELIKPLNDSQFSCAIEQVQTISPIHSDENLQSPFSNSQNPLFLLKAIDLYEPLEEIMNLALISQNQKIKQLKNQFYQNNLQITKKRQKLGRSQLKKIQNTIQNRIITNEKKFKQLEKNDNLVNKFVIRKKTVSIFKQQKSDCIIQMRSKTKQIYYKNLNEINLRTAQSVKKINPENNLQKIQTKIYKKILPRRMTPMMCLKQPQKNLFTNYKMKLEMAQPSQ